MKKTVLSGLLAASAFLVIPIVSAAINAWGAITRPPTISDFLASPLTKEQQSEFASVFASMTEDNSKVAQDAKLSVNERISKIREIENKTVDKLVKSGIVPNDKADGLRALMEKWLQELSKTFPGSSTGSTTPIITTNQMPLNPILDKQVTTQIETLKKRSKGNNETFQTALQSLVMKAEKMHDTAKTEALKSKYSYVRDALAKHLSDDIQVQTGTGTVTLTKELSGAVDSYVAWVGKNMTTQAVYQNLMFGDKLAFSELNRYQNQLVLDAYAFSNGDIELFRATIREAIKKEDDALKGKLPTASDGKSGVDSISKMLEKYLTYDEKKLSENVSETVAYVQKYQKLLSEKKLVSISKLFITFDKIKIPTSLLKDAK